MLTMRRCNSLRNAKMPKSVCIPGAKTCRAASCLSACLDGFQWSMATTATSTHCHLRGVGGRVWQYSTTATSTQIARTEAGSPWQTWHQFSGEHGLKHTSLDLSGRCCNERCWPKAFETHLLQPWVWSGTAQTMISSVGSGLNKICHPKRAMYYAPMAQPVAYWVCAVHKPFYLQKGNHEPAKSLPSNCWELYMPHRQRTWLV